MAADKATEVVVGGLSDAEYEEARRLLSMRDRAFLQALGIDSPAAVAKLAHIWKEYDFTLGPSVRAYLETAGTKDEVGEPLTSEENEAEQQIYQTVRFEDEFRKAEERGLRKKHGHDLAFVVSRVKASEAVREYEDDESIRARWVEYDKKRALAELGEKSGLEDYSERPSTEHEIKSVVELLGPGRVLLPSPPKQQSVAKGNMDDKGRQDILRKFSVVASSIVAESKADLKEVERGALDGSVEERVREEIVEAFARGFGLSELRKLAEQRLGEEVRVRQPEETSRRGPGRRRLPTEHLEAIAKGEIAVSYEERRRAEKTLVQRRWRARRRVSSTEI